MRAQFCATLAAEAGSGEVTRTRFSSAGHAGEKRLYGRSGSAVAFPRLSCFPGGSHASPTAVATLLSATVLVSACLDDVEGPSGPSRSAPAYVSAATTPVFRQVSAGGSYTCGVSQDNKAYCWGTNTSGELGIGISAGPETCQPFDMPCSSRPVAVAGGHRFRYVSAGEYHACGITTDNVAYCWGEGSNGELGTGDRKSSMVPVAVATTLRFVQIAAGSGQTCGLRVPDRRAYCWGANNFGQLGIGSTAASELCGIPSFSYPCSTLPAAVAGGHTFREVTAGRLHTCGVTTTHKAYCWGSNRYGEVGDSSTAPLRRRPSLVVGGHAFVQIEAGGGQTCAVTETDRAFCWGYGGNGEIGDGTANVRFWPVRVAGGLRVERLSAGVAHTCAESTSNAAYCWGANVNGALGDGTTLLRAVPVAVAGRFTFAQVSAAQGGGHSCALTPAGAVYCWGSNFLGQLGDGTKEDRLSPTPISAP